MPIDFEILPPTVSSAEAGDVVELIRGKLEFRRDSIWLALPSPGKSQNLRFMPPHSMWDVPDDQNPYLAAWEDAGARIWVVDTTRVYLLEIGEKLVESGRWRENGKRWGILAACRPEFSDALRLFSTGGYHSRAGSSRPMR